jgi:hypothetical protein
MENEVDMPDKIWMNESASKCCIEQSHLTQYTRADLAQSLADALEGCYFLLKAHTGPDNVMAVATLEKTQAALANYRKGE